MRGEFQAGWGCTRLKYEWLLLLTRCRRASVEHRCVVGLYLLLVSASLSLLLLRSWKLTELNLPSNYLNVFDTYFPVVGLKKLKTLNGNLTSMVHRGLWSISCSLLPASRLQYVQMVRSTVLTKPWWASALFKSVCWLVSPLDGLTKLSEKSFKEKKKKNLELAPRN